MGDDWVSLKSFLLEKLRPSEMLRELQTQRERRPDYGYCQIVFRRFYTTGNNQTVTDHIDDLVRRAKADDEIKVGIDALKGYGFWADVNTYDEPWNRELQLSIKQNPDAEERMRVTERLE